jgi:predicted secreted hydrolase
MLDLNSLDSREDFKLALLNRAIKDAEYRQTLMKHPAVVLEQELGRDVASRLTLAAHQESNKQIFFVVNFNPKKPETLGALKVDKQEGVEAVLVKRAWKDPQYKAELLANPKAKIRDEFGVAFKEDVKIEVFAETPTDMHIVIPKTVLSQDAAEARLEDELSQEDLDVVSGGVCSVWNWVVSKTYKHPESQSSASGVRG